MAQANQGAGVNAGSGGRLRLVVVDVEGCIIPGARRDWPLEPLRRIARFNRWGRRHGGVELTLASGRPAQYVEAVGQAIGLRLPAICENGAFIFETASGGQTPLFGPDAAAAMIRLQQAFNRRPPVPMRVAHGKEACLSLLPEEVPEGDMEALAGTVPDVIDELLGQGASNGFQVTYSAGAVDITPAGVTKGAALRRLLERLDLTPAEAAAIGDGGNDLSMFQVVGCAGAPANALAQVKRAVDIVAEAPYGEGVLEILERLTGRPAADWEA